MMASPPAFIALRLIMSTLCLIDYMEISRLKLKPKSIYLGKGLQISRQIMSLL